MPAGCVDAVCEENDRLPTFDPAQTLVHYEIDSIIEFCAIARLSAPNRVPQPGAVVGKLTKHSHLIIKRYNHDAIVLPELINESDRCLLDFIKPKASRAAGVNHQDYRKRFID